jgi:hypothetical protein
MMRKEKYFITSFSISLHRLLCHSLVRSVILFSRNKPPRTGVKGSFAELLCVNSASHAPSGEKY